MLQLTSCRSGGIGRRAWFRSMYSQGCGGSSPFFGTNSLESVTCKAGYANSSDRNQGRKDQSQLTNRLRYQTSCSEPDSLNRSRRRYAMLVRAVQTKKDGKIRTQIPSFKAAMN